MFRFAVTIFISAFLLFQVQPMIAKFILPWFGGSSIVWTTCLMFFQVLLVGGYAYAHFVNRCFSPKTQWLLQSALLLVACCFLPIGPSDAWKPSGAGDPAFNMVILLAATIGLPFFVLTTTSPLIQAWVAATNPKRSPYRLYALSNVGSLLALLSYPFLIEPNLTVSTQSVIWSVGFGLFAIVTFWSGWKYANHQPTQTDLEELDEVEIAVKMQAEVREPISLIRIILWILLPMAASVMLVASTNLMTHEIAAVPFLWIVPLSLYLLTFVICFDHPRWYFRPIIWVLMWVAVIFGGFLVAGNVNVPMKIQVLGYSALSFLTAFACHGELAKMKPRASGLTFYFLMIGIGGALGGIFVAIIAPRIFDDYYEFHVGMFLSVVLVFVAYLYQVTNKSPDKTLSRKKNKKQNNRLPFSGFQIAQFGFYTIGTALTAAMIVSATNYYRFSELINDDDKVVVFKTRNTYGVLTVFDVDESVPRRYILNGKIDHGEQYIGSRWEHEPVSYYSRGSGLGLAMDYLRSNPPNADGTLRIGVVGLGTGTICTYTGDGDSIRFYEINAEVESIARQYFTYLEGAEDRYAEVEVVIGDGRIQLENDQKNDVGKFDILAIDAFSSDAIPAHLLTKECFELYRQRLTDDGILAVHISNRFLNLQPVVFYAAEELGWESSLIDFDGDDEDSTGSTWVLVSNHTDLHFDKDVLRESDYFNDEDPGADPLPKIMWTDNFTSIFPLVDWKDVELDDDFWWLFSGQDDDDEDE